MNSQDTEPRPSVPEQPDLVLSLLARGWRHRDFPALGERLGLLAPAP